MPKHPIIKTPIALIRWILGHSRKDFASHYKINPHSLQKIEQGKFALSNKDAEHLANELGVYASWLKQKEHEKRVVFGVGCPLSSIELPPKKNTKDYRIKLAQIKEIILDYVKNNETQKIYWTQKSKDEYSALYPRAYSMAEKKFESEWGPKKDGKYSKWEKWYNPDGTTPNKDLVEIESRTKKILNEFPSFKPEINATWEKNLRERSFGLASFLTERIERIFWEVALRPSYQHIAHQQIYETLQEIERDLKIERGNVINTPHAHLYYKAMIRSRSAEFKEIDERSKNQTLN